jgi:hypothetical protein
MTMRIWVLRSVLSFWIVVAAVPLTVCGGTLAPLIRASQSANGKFLVVTEWEYDSPNRQVPRMLVSSTYRVLQVEEFINDKDRLDGATTFWSDSDWEVSREGRDFCWPLVSNNGQYLILVRVAPPFSGMPVMLIYHRELSGDVIKGVLVRQISINDLWNERELDPDGTGALRASDSTRQWFSGGSLRFSTDDVSLIYRTQWNDVLNLRLADGTITPQAP